MLFFGAPITELCVACSVRRGPQGVPIFPLRSARAPSGREEKHLSGESTTRACLTRTVSRRRSSSSLKLSQAGYRGFGARQYSGARRERRIRGGSSEIP